MINITKPKPLALTAAIAISFLVASQGSARAAFNEPSEHELAAKEREEMLDVTVTQFRKDGTSGAVFEFTPVSFPSLRCVAFYYGQPSGVQCFPRPEAPKPK